MADPAYLIVSWIIGIAFIIYILLLMSQNPDFMTKEPKKRMPYVYGFMIFIAGMMVMIGFTILVEKNDMFIFAIGFIVILISGLLQRESKKMLEKNKF